MRSRADFVKPLVVSWCLLLFCIMTHAVAQTTVGSAFSYQGQLRSNGNPMTATCDFQFKLYDAATGGHQIGSTLKMSNIQVSNGLFNAELDFGRNVFSGSRWLEVAVGYPAGTTPMTTLAPRHKLVPAPYALYAAGVADGTVTSMSLGSGAVTNQKIATWAVTSTKLAAQAVTNGALADGAVTDIKIANVKWNKILGAPTALPPCGPAGGALSGAFPNPLLAANTVSSATLADGSVTGTKLADNAVTSRTLADNAVTSRTIADGAVTTEQIRDGAVSNEKILSVDWIKITGAPQTLPPGGAAGGDLAGNYPNPTIGNNAVTVNKIADGAVTNAKIASGVAWNKITGAPVSYPPSGAAGGALTGTYPNPLLANQAVTSGALASRSVITSKIAAGAVTSPTLALNAVTTGSIINGAVTDDKISGVSWTKIIGAPGAYPPSGTAGGDLTGAYPSPAIANGAVSESKIADGAVTNAKIAAVDWTKITGAPATYPPVGAAGGVLTGSYPNPLIANNAVTSSALADGAVTSRTLASLSVTTANLADGTVTSRTLALNAVTSGSILNGAVTNEKILNVEWSKVTGSPDSMDPSGPAGGALAGSYPNPTLAANAVTSATILNGAVTDEKIAGVSWNKVYGAPITYPPDGIAGGALTGAYPNPMLANNAVTSPALADGAVTSRTLALNAVTSASILNGAVTDAKIEGVSWSKVYNAPGDYPPSGAAGGALSGAYPNPILAVNAVTSATILSGAVTDEKIAGVSWTKIIGAPPTYPPNGAAGGALTGSYPNPTIANGAVTSAALASGAVDNTKIALPLLFDGTTAAAPDSILKVVDHGPGRAIDALSYSVRSGIRGQSLGLNGYGIYGLADNGTLARGVGGESLGGTGVYGESVTGYGVQGLNVNTSNFGYLGTQFEGVYGEGIAPDTNGVTGASNSGAAGSGVAGYAVDGSGVFGVNQTSGNYGFLGTMTCGADTYSTSGTAVSGVTSTGIAIYGKADLHGQAGHFDGNALVNGNLNVSGNINTSRDLNVAGSKNFRIDHPLDPENMVLVHASVEGPERMNIYNGNVVTDKSGFAQVELPAYFEALNVNPRYQLTVIEHTFAQAIVFEEIKNNRFTIRTDRGNVKVSWQVIGTRQDAYSLAHPFVAEQPKCQEQ